MSALPLDFAMCVHAWGEAEECETGMGLVRSPVCQHCGALKFDVDLRERRRLEINRAEAPVVWRPRVHTHQAQMFPEV